MPTVASVSSQTALSDSKPIVKRRTSSRLANKQANAVTLGPLSKAESVILAQINEHQPAIILNATPEVADAALVPQSEPASVAPPPLPKVAEILPVPVKKIDWEIPRKTLHSSIGLGVLALYAGQFHIPPIITSLAVLLVVNVVFDIFRFRSKGFAVVWERCVGFLMRESEKEKINGTIWYLIGVIFCLGIYPMDIAIVSILILSWADTAASTIGRLWGRRTPPLPSGLRFLGIKFAARKSTAGFAAAFVAGCLIASTFWGLEGHLSTLPQSFAIPPALAMKSWHWEQRVGGGWAGLALLGVCSGLITAVAEALDLGDTDDNLTLPIISGAGIWAYFTLLNSLDVQLRSLPEL